MARGVVAQVAAIAALLHGQTPVSGATRDTFRRILLGDPVAAAVGGAVALLVELLGAEHATIDDRRNLHRLLDHGISGLQLHGEGAAILAQHQVERLHWKRIAAVFRNWHAVGGLVEGIARLALPGQGEVGEAALEGGGHFVDGGYGRQLDGFHQLAQMSAQGIHVRIFAGGGRRQRFHRLADQFHQQRPHIFSGHGLAVLRRRNIGYGLGHFLTDQRRHIFHGHALPIRRRRDGLHQFGQVLLERVHVGILGIRHQFCGGFRQRGQVNPGGNLVGGRDHLGCQRLFQLLDAGNQRRRGFADDCAHRLAELYWVDH
ncbi:hypothetical protein D9M69_375040 [compost metagenome]